MISKISLPPKGSQSFFYKDFLFLITLIVLSIFLFWKCQYGFANIDETFYITIPYRLYQGDALFREEWHLSQMSSVLLYPFVASYLSVTGSTNGIVLAMRYMSTAVHCLSSIFLYYRLKSIHWLGAWIATVSFLLFIPLGIMAMSYHSLGILFLLFSLVILLTTKKKKQAQYAIAGLCFAAAVLCCPYLILLYFLYLGVVAANRFIQKRKNISEEESIWTIQVAFWFSCGAAVVAFVFFAFVLSRCSVETIIKVIPSILNDPQHAIESPFYKPRRLLATTFLANTWTPYLYSALIILILIYLLDKRRKQHHTIYTFILTVCGFLLVLAHWILEDKINHLMWAINVYACFLLPISQNESIRRIYFTIWLPGMLYAVCMHYASNQEFYAISAASSVATAGSLMMVTIFLQDLIQHCEKKLLTHVTIGLICAMLLIQLTSQTVLRYKTVFWEQGGMQNMTIKIDSGIESGLLVSPKYYEEYQKSIRIQEALSQYDGETILFLCSNTWCYLQTDREMAGYSAWASGINAHTLSRLEHYYFINPHKMPDIVFVEQKFEAVAHQFCDMFSYHLQSIDEGYVLLPQ